MTRIHEKDTTTMLRRPIARAARPGLLRTAATTAVVAGTATAVSGRVARRQASANQAAEAQAYEQQQQMAAQQAAAQPAAAVPLTAAAPESDTITQLKELAALKEQGVLTEEEFAAQKAKVLGS